MISSYRCLLLLSSGLAFLALNNSAFAQSTTTTTSTTEQSSSVVKKKNNDKKQASEESSGKNEQIVVTGHKNSIVVKNSSAATKTDTPLIYTPESVSTVSQAQWQAQNATSVQQALRYSSGVAMENRGATTRYDLGTIRGFTSTEYLDGLIFWGGNYYATQQMDVNLLERIDVLKGPASSVYGQANPGGIIVMTSKFADGNRHRSVVIEGGSYDYVRGTFDIGDKVGNLDNLSWRLVATSYRQDGVDWYTKSESYAFQPSINWKPTEDIDLTVYARYQKEPSSNSYQTFPYQAMLHSSTYNFPTNYWTGDKNYEKFDRSQAAVGYKFTYQINPEWQFRSLARYTNVGANYNQVYSSGGLSAGYTPGSQYISRYINGSKEHLDTMIVEEQLHGNVHTGPVAHDLLLGVNWQNIRDSYDYGWAAATSLDLYNQNHRMSSITMPSPTTRAAMTTNQEAIFLQDNMSYKRLHVQLGFRNDWSVIKTRNHVDSSSNASQSDQAFTFRGGLLYALPHGISPYFSYAQSFTPTTTINTRTGEAFKPSRGEQYEFGVKYQPEHFNGFFTAAVYNDEQTNIVTTDPENINFQIQTGKMRSRGVELEAHLTPIAGLNLIGAFTHQKVKYTSGDYAGNRPTQVPANMFSFWSDYTIQKGTFKNLGGGIGVRYVGNTNGDYTMFLRTPAYTLIDMQAHYKFDDRVPTLNGLDVQVTAQNLTNKRYYTACYSASFGCALAYRRSIIGKLAYNW